MTWLSARIRRRLLAAAAVGVAGAAGAYYIYYRWLKEEDDDAPPGSYGERSASRRSMDATSRALGVQGEADANLQNHFQSIQSISDSTTLPQMLVELARGLDRAANVDVLIAQLRQSKNLPGASKSVSKVDLWQELKVVSFARTLSATWLVALLDLLLRVQLNILGRHLFLQTHILDAATNGWSSQAPARRVTERAQEMFLEYAHYLPERATARVVARMKQAVAAALRGLDLSRPLDAAGLLTHASTIHSEFEAWAMEQGWAQLVLPTKAEAAEYFARFRQAPPDADALRPGVVEVDEDVVEGMIDETHRIMQSARFSVAVLAAVQQTAKQVAEQLQGALGGASIPLAKAIPKVAAAGNLLLDPHTPQGSQCINSIAELAPVRELCASVYSCGPPP